MINILLFAMALSVPLSTNLNNNSIVNRKDANIRIDSNNDVYTYSIKYTLEDYDLSSRLSLAVSNGSAYFNRLFTYDVNNYVLHTYSASYRNDNTQVSYSSVLDVLDSYDNYTFGFCDLGQLVYSNSYTSMYFNRIYFVRSSNNTPYNPIYYVNEDTQYFDYDIEVYRTFYDFTRDTYSITDDLLFTESSDSTTTLNEFFMDYRTYVDSPSDIPIYPYLLSDLSVYYHFADIGSVQTANFQTDFIIGLSNMYDKGYTAGYTAGYDAGSDSGYSNGYSEGYSEGYLSGQDVDSTASAIFTGIIDVGLLPINFFLQILNFEVFGINIGGFVSALMTIAIVVIILRVVMGGKNDA